MAPRLKSLELHGYKTFASRSMFEFPGIITAIVGPNGSGKSNISDALRWVLGEQSYSLLRGRKTEDMIFSGSEQRPRAGMASATITFDNSDGWLPIDYSEVSIARRAFRDGDNEYLLNGQRVRLKEISELLAQSGLAERTYTMIGQGLVDAALSLKPEERRRFFEEAAGIGLYRARREESITRLENTKRNLERVLDIISELEPRLKSLERQAQRAIEYDRIKADLRVLLRDWYGYHWHHSQQEFQHAREVVRVQEERLEQAREKYSGVEIEAGLVRERLLKVRSDLNEWHARLAEQHTLWEKSNRGLAVMDERERAMLDQAQGLERELVRLEQEQKAQQDRYDSILDESARLAEELEDARSQAKTAQANLEARQRERGKTDQELRDARRNVLASETKQVQLKAHQNELATRLESLRKSQNSVEQEIAGAGEVLNHAQKRYEEAARQRQTVERDRSVLEEALQTAQTQINALEEQRKQDREQMTRVEAELTRLKAQLEVLEQAERSLSGLNQGAKSVLQAARAGKLPGGYQALSGKIEIPVEYEAAIAAALGENLDAVLLAAKTDPEIVLQLLEKGDQGRAVLYPAEWALPDEQIQLPVHEDCIGLAADLIQAPEELQVVLNALLGRVVIVRQRGAARKILSMLPKSAKVVTLKGEVFTGSGAVIAGQEGRTNIVSRPRQRRELSESIESAQLKIKQFTDILATHETAINTHRSGLRDAETALRQNNQRMQVSVQALQQATLSLEQARQKQDWQRRQLTAFAEQVQSAEKELEQSSKEYEKIGAQLQEMNNTVRGIQRKLDGLPLDELQTQVVHWNTATAVSERSVRDANRRQQEYQLVLVANKNLHAQIISRQSSLDEARNLLQLEKQDLRDKEKTLNRVIEDLQSQITPAEQQLEALERENTEIQARLASAQQAVTVSERYSSQAYLDFSRQKEALDNLRRRIEDDFGLVALEYTTASGPAPLPLDGLVEELPAVLELPADLEDNINRQRGQLRRMGAINPEAQSEYLSVKERFVFMNTQVADLRKADTDLRQVIAELDTLMKIEFKRTFDAVAAEFRQMFTRLFGGGSARLILTDEDNPTETGIDIEAKLPGRREQGLSLLSGGERSLTAVALVFSLLKVSPTPFCVMDEVDAMLDEANVGRFCDLLKELSSTTQFVLITHNRNTVQTADVIYGVTMGRDSVSQVISLRLDEISEDMVR